MVLLVASIRPPPPPRCPVAHIVATSFLLRCVAHVPAYQHRRVELLRGCGVKLRKPRGVHQACGGWCSTSASVAVAGGTTTSTAGTSFTVRTTHPTSPKLCRGRRTTSKEKRMAVVEDNEEGRSPGPPTFRMRPPTPHAARRVFTRAFPPSFAECRVPYPAMGDWKISDAFMREMTGRSLSQLHWLYAEVSTSAGLLPPVDASGRRQRTPHVPAQPALHCRCLAAERAPLEGDGGRLRSTAPVAAPHGQAGGAPRRRLHLRRADSTHRCHLTTLGPCPASSMHTSSSTPPSSPCLASSSAPRTSISGAPQEVCVEGADRLRPLSPHRRWVEGGAWC